MEAVKTTTLVTETPAEQEVKGKVVKKSGKRIGFNYIILKSLKESKKNDVVKCLYIKSLVNFGICVIKEGTYGDTKDKEGRDIKDRLIWQKELHEELQDKVRLPRYLGSFEENGNYYLVIERIKGKSLYKACRENHKELREGLINGTKLGLKFLDYMIQLCDLLDALHKNGVIHRDVSSNNFMIMPSGKMAVIDMELSYSFKKQFPSPPFQLGTHGYMSPQQESQQSPSIEDDIFSVGAIFLQIWTGISPSKITGAPVDELKKKVNFFIPDHEIAEIILQCLDPNPVNRPALHRVKQVIKVYKRDLKAKKQRKLYRLPLYSKEEISDTIQQSIATLASPLFADEEKGWFSEDRKAEFNPDKKKINKAWYTSFSVGSTGVMYFLGEAKKVGFDTLATMSYLQKTLELIETKYINRLEKVSPSLHFGSSGIAASLATAIKHNLFEPQAPHFEWVNRLLNVENKQLNYLDGISGQGMANWCCAPFLHEGEMQERLESYVHRLLERQHKDGYWITGKVKNKTKITKGFSRGAAGMIYFLLEYAMQYQDRNALTGALRGLHWLGKTAKIKNGVTRWNASGKKELGNNWNEGNAGIALSFFKAYQLLGESKYKKIASEALFGNPKDIIENNLSQLNGLSGLGEVYLEAWHALKQDEWYDRAGWIAQVIMHLKKDHIQHGPHWFVAHERQPVADFMTGNSGVLHYLLRYTNPEKVSFPLL